MRIGAPERGWDAAPTGEGEEHPRLREHESLHEESEPEGGKGEVHALQPDRGQGDQSTDGNDHERGEKETDEPRQVRLRGELGEDGGTDRRERGVTQRHHPARADQQPERQHQRRLGEPEGEVGEVVASEPGDEREQREDDDAHPHSQFERAAPRKAWSLLRLGPRREPVLWEGDEHDEQHDERQRVGKAGQAIPPVLRDDVPDDVLGDPDGEPADEGERDVRERSDRRGAEGVHGEEGEVVGLQADEREDQHPGQRRKRAAEHPGDASHAGRTCAGEVEQVGVVDGGAHLPTETGQSEQEVEQRRRHDGHDRRDDLVAEDVHPDDAVAIARTVAQREEPGDLQGVVAARVEDEAQRGNEHGEPDRADDLERSALAGDVAGEQLHHESEPRPGDTDGEDDGDRPRPPDRDAEGVVEHRRSREDRTVAEVQDARRFERQREAGPGEAVDHPRDQAREDERKQFVHAGSSPRVSPRPVATVPQES